MKLRSVAVCAGLLLPSQGSAQEPLWDQLQSRVKSEPISLGVLFQFVGDAQSDRSFPGESGFSVANFRFSLGGRLDGGFEYFLQSNFGSLLDARIGFNAHPSLAIDAGRFKTPYSREFLTGAGGIDFVNRSQSVTALAPNRALGVAIRGPLAEELSYSVGVFNGGAGVRGNPRGEMMGVARVGWQRDGLEVAVNAARNGDRRVLDPEDDPTFSALRTLVGFDVLFTQGAWMTSGEFHIGDGRIGTPDDPWGGFATLGYVMEENGQLLVRLDHFDTGVAGDVRTLLIPGWNLWPTAATELQVNVVLPLEGFDGDPRLLVNLQLAF